MTLVRVALAARLLLGGFYLVSGLNWIFGYISFLPHIGMPPDLPMRHEVVAEMVQTGWMYQSAKIIEIAVGLALVTNRFVPLMLAAAIPVALITCVLGLTLILGDIAGWFAGTVDGSVILTKIGEGATGGLILLLLHTWLALCYFDYYRPALVARAVTTENPPIQTPTGSVRALKGRAFMALGCVAIALQAYNFYLFVGLIGK